MCTVSTHLGQVKDYAVYMLAMLYLRILHLGTPVQWKYLDTKAAGMVYLALKEPHNVLFLT